jgi:hypothetical protein
MVVTDRVGEEFRLLEKLRNLSIMPIDDEHIELTSRDDEELP